MVGSGFGPDFLVAGRKGCHLILSLLASGIGQVNSLPLDVLSLADSEALGLFARIATNRAILPFYF